MSLNLDDETEFWSGINNKLILILMNLHIYRDLYSDIMKSYLSMFTKKYPNISTNYNKVQEIYTNSNIDETNLTYYMYYKFRTIMASVRLCILTCGTFAYHDPYNLKGKRIYRYIIQHIIR